MSRVDRKRPGGPAGLLDDGEPPWTTDRGARAAALSILNAKACCDLLRAHGESEHAANFEAALQKALTILADYLGPVKLAEALDWASDESWGCASADPTSPRN